MNARDELAELAYLSMYPKSADVNRIQPLQERAAWEIEMHERAADAILAAGYRKPRTITTAEELDALPGGSIIRDADGCGWQKYNRPLFNQPMWFSATRNDGFYFSSNFVDGNRTPATVLHEPEAAA